MDAQTKKHLILGRTFYQVGNYDEARPHLLEVLKHHNHFADIHNILGVIDYEAGRFRDARVHFEHALKINPTYTEAALHLSVCYNELGRYGDAREVYTRALQGRTSQEEQRNEEQALADLDAFVRGKIANLHRDVGDAYLAIAQLERACEAFAAALELCPTFPDIRLKLATTLRDLQRCDEACEHLERLRHERPDFALARLQLGITYWALEKHDDARHEWQSVLTTDPGNKSAAFYLAAYKNDGG